MIGSGLILPFVLPKVWGKYPDQVIEDDRRQRELEELRKAYKEVGMFLPSPNRISPYAHRDNIRSDQVPSLSHFSALFFDLRTCLRAPSYPLPPVLLTQYHFTLRSCVLLI